MAIAENDLKARLLAAERIARQAGATALQFFNERDRLYVSHKGAQDRVSEADRNVEDQIRTSISAEFPDDALLGEEHGGKAGRSPFCWVIDPIDGTTPFLAGLSGWCVSIAVAVDSWPVVGVIEAPSLRETWVGGKGLGATVNGRPLRFNPKAELTTGMFALGSSLKCDPVETGHLVTRLMQSGGAIYDCGSGALMTAFVADGRLIGYYDAQINAWDCFAGLVLAGEAGARITYGDASRMHRRGPMLVGAPRAFEQVQALLPQPKS